MKFIFLIAANGLKEVIRHKFFYGIVLLSFLIIGMGLALGPLSMSEQKRVAVDFSLFGVQIVLIAICIFFGSLSITRDIEKKVLMTLISRPIPRPLYIVGKFFSVAVIALFSLSVLALFTGLLLYWVGVPLNVIFLKALWGIYLEAMVLLSISILLSTFTSPFLIICFSFGFFIIGHWIDSVRLILEKAESFGARFFSDYVLFLFPNLEKFNWRPHMVYQDLIPFEEAAFYTFYALSWIALSLFIAVHIFNKKDFV